MRPDDGATHLPDTVPSSGPTDPLPLGDSIGFTIRDLNRALQRSLQSRIQPHGVPPGAWYFLRVLWEADGMTQRELAQRVGMMEPTAVIALRGMEAQGWIWRERSDRDRRKVHIFLTASGRTIREALMPAAHAVNVQAVQGLSGDEVRTLKALLQRMRANFGPPRPVGVGQGPEAEA